MDLVKNLVIHIVLSPLDIQILYKACILFDKFTSWFYLVTHKCGKYKVNFGGSCLIHCNAEKNPW